MNISVLKGLLISTIALCIVSSCEKPNDVEPENEWYQDPVNDSIYPGKTKQFIDEFYADESYYGHTLGSPYFNTMDYAPNVLSGIKDGHLCFKVISKDGECISMEYVSPDYIQNLHSYSYSYYAGYGEWIHETVDVKSAFMVNYYELGDYRIIFWMLSCLNDKNVTRYFYRTEFLKGNEYKSIDVSNIDNIVVGNNSIFFNNQCYSLEGSLLYDLVSMSFIIPTNNKKVVFLSEEEILYMSYDGSLAFFQRINLKTGNYVWDFYPSTEHNLKNPKTEFYITNIEGSIWEFICYALGYDGTKIKLSAVIDIDNPGDFTMNEEVIQ